MPTKTNREIAERLSRLNITSFRLTPHASRVQLASDIEAALNTYHAEMREVLEKLSLARLDGSRCFCSDGLYNKTHEENCLRARAFYGLLKAEGGPVGDSAEEGAIESRENNFFCESCKATFTERPHATNDGYWLCDPCWRELCGVSDLESLAAETVEVCNLHGWSLHWTGRAAALHLESSELIEAVRGKRGDPAVEAGDVLFALLSILHPKGITFASAVAALQKKITKLKTSEREELNAD